ncbi:hypothetical protein BDP55DRAFT_632814 [Colletotrichum godetiae]|uniref:Uncharacterized protein n=1 Tax=Colletotrichum godetiae TaxID=1209918 RepID=A0AAJ0AK67_9PEZI|nr:uncharacterized protein BDP55DRAFT_632814 [Colletotrichum godetiae]KAK1674750.1 hypothetical protein BDP55DRAFT_632814 [Colletotrichum godetiae]
MPLSPRLPRSPLLLQLAPWLWRSIFTFTTPILKGCTYSPSVGEVCIYYTISCGSRQAQTRVVRIEAAIWRRAEETQQTRVALDRVPLADTEDNTIEQQRTDSRYCGPRRHAALRSVYASWRPLNRTHCEGQTPTLHRVRNHTGLLYCVGSGDVLVLVRRAGMPIPDGQAMACALTCDESSRKCDLHRTWLKDYSWRGGSRAASAATGRKRLAVYMCLDSLVNPTTSGRPELSSSEERDGKEPQRNLAVRVVQKHFLVAAAAARSAHKPKKLIFDESEEFTSCVPGPTVSRHPTTEPTTPWWPKMGYGKGKKQPSPES